jgi:hypothetical protein
VKTTLTIFALVLLACVGTAQGKGYHYHASKAPSYSYHAPKVYVPRSTIVTVRGYMKSNGAYVAPHYQTAPNATNLDNWSSKPNVNPYTGEQGTKEPYNAKCCDL